MASVGSAGIDTFDDDDLDEYVGPGPLNWNAGAFTYPVQAAPEPLDVLGNSFAMKIIPTAADAFLVLGSARAVPEPASVWLLLPGAGGIGVVALRRRAHR